MRVGVGVGGFQNELLYSSGRQAGRRAGGWINKKKVFLEGEGGRGGCDFWGGGGRFCYVCAI